MAHFDGHQTETLLNEGQKVTPGTRRGWRGVKRRVFAAVQPRDASPLETKALARVSDVLKLSLTPCRRVHFGFGFGFKLTFVCIKVRREESGAGPYPPYPRTPLGSLTSPGDPPPRAHSLLAESYVLFKPRLGGGRNDHRRGRERRRSRGERSTPRPLSWPSRSAPLIKRDVSEFGPEQSGKVTLGWSPPPPSAFRARSGGSGPVSSSSKLRESKVASSQSAGKGGEPD
ncbi:hypothetical protein SKAU_G00188420 [Synaphobranchus kaupii]|uniref:Uncharacterized protein n=1 Tax=Synaphobranchus kaupii TaxID=118154 RepID=A0A9Q1IX01_SYNKA|nr:hypothetical protein SKAU_G00188420 [Synaphobranchus kaupii]